jgi:hypothetical protein
MTLSHEKLSKALVLLILATSFLLSRHIFWVVTNLEFYTSLVGVIWIAGVVPYFLVVVGCILFLLNKKFGLPTIVVGGVLSFFSASWSYIPYLPDLSADPVARFALMVMGNLFVLALLVWSVRRRPSDENVAKSY